MERLTYRDDNGRALLTHFGKQMYCSTQATADCVCMLEERFEEAISLLKEQEPIAPKLIKMYPHDIYECGNCGHRSVGSKDYKAKYCPECGQAVKWDE